MMTQLEIIGMSMECENPEDIIEVINKYSKLEIEEYIVGCAWAMDHFSRRFKRTDQIIWKRIIENSMKFKDNEFVQDVIDTVGYDISENIKP